MKKLNEVLLICIIYEIDYFDNIQENSLATRYNVSERTIRRYFKILKDNNYIELNRNGNNRYWMIKRNYDIIYLNSR